LIFPLCHSNEINDPGSKSFEIKYGRKTISLFVVHKDGSFNAYINSCPHTGVNLDWQQDQFLDMDNMFIQCSTHDALFEIDTGNCVAGPCVGDHLQAVKLVIENGQISAQLDPP
jgi:nitrite reductase/ring-hydroxylating ferredoxin subunit